MGRYDRQLGYGSDYRELNMRPQQQRGQTADPNYEGQGYGGMRMQPGNGGQGAYGWYRATHARDLGEFGGFDGRYGDPHGRQPGHFDRDGLYRDTFDRAGHGSMRGDRTNPIYNGEYEAQYNTGQRYHVRRGYDAGFGGHGGDGGVRGDTRYLGQYNRNSPALQGGYDRSYGFAEHPRQGGGAMQGGAPGPTNENQYGGRNSGGFSEMNRPRQALR
jgi:hypothetical protein